MKKILFLLFTFYANGIFAQQEFPLYETKIPNSKPVKNKETSTNNGILIISNVTIPTLTAYLPEKPCNGKSSVIICPGGGYGILAAGHEGSDVAKVLNSLGVTAFVLKYRLPNSDAMIDRGIAPLQDAQRAIQVVRENAKKWNLDPNKIGIMGFSAGGHLAASASTLFDTILIENNKNTSLRPDFSILIYPVISFSDSLTHLGSRENLIGLNPNLNLIEHYSCEKQVTQKTPPAFIVHASDDIDVLPENSISYFQSLQKYKIHSELIIYPYGGHGFGMTTKSGDNWIENLKIWLKPWTY